MREEALYMLRLWRDGSRTEDWRGTLTNVRTQQVHQFASWEGIVNFLRESVVQEQEEPEG